jgi:hypothetical protein
MGAPALVSLQSDDHKTLLDTIDKLRSKGISRYVDLPQIVVSEREDFKYALPRLLTVICVGLR